MNKYSASMKFDPLAKHPFHPSTHSLIIGLSRIVPSKPSNTFFVIHKSRKIILLDMGFPI